MRNKKIRQSEEDFKDDPADWLDEDLDADAKDLNEWAFLQGYYGDLEED